MNGKLARALRRWATAMMWRRDGMPRRLTASEYRRAKRMRKGIPHRQAGKDRRKLELAVKVE